jgi:hypothetical protein
VKRKLTPEHRAKIALANTGKRRSPEVKIKMSLARRAMLRRRQAPGLVRS